MNIIEIVKKKIEVEVLIDKVKSPKCGAISVFLGTTRNTFQDLEVITLFYEAYESMAMKAIEAICNQIRNKWPLIENIAVSHRLGEVGVTETSVVIAISSPHRAESLAAVNFAIEELKSTVPIWKKEIYKEDVGKWKENKECAWRTNENHNNSV